jgi:Disulphide bond corrector protein DsbC
MEDGRSNPTTPGIKRLMALVGLLGLAAPPVRSQIVSQQDGNQPGHEREQVAYLFPDQVTVAAGKPSLVGLHFRVQQGLHINSHTPKDAYLIPTNFSIPASAGVRLDAVQYPTGHEMTLAVDPQTRLSVYTGEFVVQARLFAAAGDHRVDGELHYQACDRNKCMPPETLTVPLDITGK